MYLELGSGKTLNDPSLDQITDALRALPGGDGSVAILSWSPNVYIQCMGSERKGFVLEYQEGSLDKHYIASDNHLSLATVTRAFQSAASGDEGWRTQVTWEVEAL